VWIPYKTGGPLSRKKKMRQRGVGEGAFTRGDLLRTKSSRCRRTEELELLSRGSYALEELQEHVIGEWPSLEVISQAALRQGRVMFQLCSPQGVQFAGMDLDAPEIYRIIILGKKALHIKSVPERRPFIASVLTGTRRKVRKNPNRRETPRVRNEGREKKQKHRSVEET